MWRAAALVVLASLLVACGHDDGGRPTRAGVDVSAIPASYRMVLHASCGERQLIGSFSLVVRGGRVVEAGPADAVRRAGLRLRDFPTLAGLVDKAENAERSAVVDLRVDESGVPTYLSIDHDPRAVDDEECYRVTRVRPLPD